MKYGLMYELTSRIRIIITTRTCTWIVLFNLQIAFRYSLTSDHYKKNTLWNQHYYNPHHVDEEADRQDEAELKSLRTITLNNVSFVSITIGTVIFFCNNVTYVYKRHRKWFFTVYKRHKKWQQLISKCFISIWSMSSMAHSENQPFLPKTKCLHTDPP